MVIVLGNAYLTGLAVQRVATPTSFAVYNVCELMLLSLIGHAALIPVPREARIRGPEQGGFPGRVLIWLFIVAWLGGVYGLSLVVDANFALVLHDHDVIDVLTRLNVLWPLLLSGLLAVLAVIGDWRLWHRRGGLFVPEMALPTVPKVLTLFFAPIPATMACFTFIDDRPGIALLAWCAVYLLVKCLLELGVLAFQCFGMSAGGMPAQATAPARACDSRPES